MSLNGEHDSPHPPVLPTGPDYDWLRVGCLIVIALVVVGTAYLLSNR